jgi:hypothetical protein
VRPRLRQLSRPPADRLVGISCVVIASVSIAPLPLTGWLPAAALVVVSVGLLERDGVIVLCGLGLGTIAIGVFVGVVAGLVEAGEQLQEMTGALHPPI